MKAKTKWKNVLMNIGILGIVILYLSPVIWMVLSSLKKDIEIFQYPPTFLPAEPTVQAYIDQIHGDLLPSLRNSVVISSLSMVISLVLGTPAAYGLASFRSKLRKPMILGFLVTQMLPPALLLTPLFLFYTKVHIINTLWAPIISTATLSIPFIVILMRPFFASLPKSVEEAARLDGCTIFSAFWRVMLPIAKPGMITSAIFSFIFPWNDLVYSISFVSNSSLWPMTANINDFQTKYGTKWNSILAFGVCLIIPIVIAFIFMQKYIVSGLTAGAVKE